MRPVVALTATTAYKTSVERARTLRELVDRKDLTGAIALYAVLNEVANDRRTNGLPASVFDLSYADLSGLVGMAENTIKRHAAILERSGHVQRLQRKDVRRKGFKNLPTRWVLRQPVAGGSAVDPPSVSPEGTLPQPLTPVGQELIHLSVNGCPTPPSATASEVQEVLEEEEEEEEELCVVGRRTNGPDGARVESIPDAEVLPAEPYLAAAAEVLPELPGVETAITIAILVETYGFDLDDREPLQVAARRKQWMTWSTWAKETGARPVGAGVAGA